MGTSSPPLGYDLIGDIHGCANPLKTLLSVLGYKKKRGAYAHPTRKVIFLGDIVDRGPKIREVLHIVYDMVANKNADLILGNHEYDLLTFSSLNDKVRENHFTPRQTQRKEATIAHTLEQFSAFPGDLAFFLDWFATLPIFLEHKNFRAVHACWDQAMIDTFLHKNPSSHLNAALVKKSLSRNSFTFRFIDRLTRGIDIPLPQHEEILGQDGCRRKSFRAAFWKKKPLYYSDIAFQPDPLPAHLSKKEITQQDKNKLCYYGPDNIPLFIGHYWLSSIPKPLCENIACLDYGAVKKGRLVAYRMDGEQKLKTSKFVSVLIH